MPAWPDLLDAEDQKPSIPTTSAGVSSGSSTRYSVDSDIEIVDPPGNLLDRKWPRITHLTDPPSGGKLNLTTQNAAIKSIVQLGIKKVFGQLFFINAFPDGNLRIKFNRDAIYDAATELDYADIAHRISNDVAYVNRLSPLVS
jgi:hypothetical protein